MISLVVGIVCLLYLCENSHVILRSHSELRYIAVPSQYVRLAIPEPYQPLSICLCCSLQTLCNNFKSHRFARTYRYVRLIVSLFGVVHHDSHKTNKRSQWSKKKSSTRGGMGREHKGKMPCPLGLGGIGRNRPKTTRDDTGRVWLSSFNQPRHTRAG